MAVTSGILHPAGPAIDLDVADERETAQGLASPDYRRKIINCVSRAQFDGTFWRVAAIARELKSSGIDTVILMPMEEKGEFRRFLDFHQIPHIECRLRAAGRLGRWRNNMRFLLGLVPEIRSLVRILRDQDADLVHVNGSSNVAPLVAAALTGHPALWHWNDMLVPRWIARGLKLISLASRAHIVVASSPVAQHYRFTSRSTHYLGVLQPPLPPENLDPAPGLFTVAPLPSLPAGRPILGFVSNLLKAKGAMEFVETVALLRDRGVMVSGIMIGGVLPGHEPFHEKLLCRIRDLKVADQIVLTGYRYDVMSMMRRFDVLLYPSHSDASPIVVTQALAAGVPIVATEVGDIPQKLDGLDMPIVAIGDVPAMTESVARLLKLSTDAQETYKQAAEQRVADTYSIEEIAARHIAAYNAALHSELVSKHAVPM